MNFTSEIWVQILVEVNLLVIDMVKSLWYESTEAARTMSLNLIRELMRVFIYAIWLHQIILLQFMCTFTACLRRGWMMHYLRMACSMNI